jgi:hypothetical protein
MTGEIEQHWENEESENVLKPFLNENLPVKFEINEGEMITDALVLVRIVNVGGELQDGDTGFGERYEYTTTKGLAFATARGMIQCVHEQMIDFYSDVIQAGKEEEEDG